MSDEHSVWRSAGVAVLGLALLAFLLAMNPVNLPESWVERWLDARLPAGSSIVAVRQAIDDRKWTTVDEGMSKSGSLVLVHLGDSWLPRRYVYAFFAFDRYGRLTSIDVQKEVTARVRSR